MFSTSSLKVDSVGVTRSGDWLQSKIDRMRGCRLLAPARASFVIVTVHAVPAVEEVLVLSSVTIDAGSPTP